MTNTAETKRTSAEVGAEIQAKRDREGEVRDRLTTMAPEMEQALKAYARAVADGNASATEKTRAKVRTLAEEEEGLKQALTLLAEDLAQLERELKEAHISEASEERERLHAIALNSFTEFDALFRRLFAEELAPAATKVLTELFSLRTAINAHQRLTNERQTGPFEDVLTLPADTPGAAETYFMLNMLRAFSQTGQLHGPAHGQPVMQPAPDARVIPNPLGAK